MTPARKPSSRSVNWRNLALVERLVSEFEAGRFDSALVRRSLGRGAFPRLLRASYMAEAGLLTRVRAELDAVMVDAAGHPLAELVAGQLRFVTRDYQRALDHYAAAESHSSGGPLATRGRQMAINAAVTLGWDHDALALLERAIVDEPEHEGWRAQAVRAYSRGGWYARALDHAEAVLARSSANASLAMECAGMHARLGQREAALARLRVGLARAPDDRRSDYLREAARVASDAGDFELARECLHQALDPLAEQPEVRVGLAELAAWSGDGDRARAEAQRALALEPEHGPALRVLASLAVLEGRYEPALELLERALRADPRDYQAHLWMARAALETGAYGRAHSSLDAGIAGAGEPILAGNLLRYLTVLRADTRASESISDHVRHEFGEGLAELVEGAEATLARGQSAEVMATIEAGLAALGANLSKLPTRQIEGRLHRLRAGTGARYASRQALQLLRVAPPSECLRRLDALVERFPGSSLPVCHRGELHLWTHDFAAARADLDAAIATVRGTRWAYMGLSTLDLLAGDPSACLETNARGVEVMSNTEGLAIHVFRGEALRKLGRLDEAAIELERALEAHPSRASATINLALLRIETGELEAARVLWRRLVIEQASGLMSDAARERGQGLADDPLSDPPEAMRAVLERALEMMGGNRSSSLLTYWTAGGQLRFVQQWPHGLASPHTHDVRRLKQARSLVVRALAAAGG